MYDGHRFAASIILSVTYGKPSPSNTSDPDVAQVRQNLKNLSTTTRPGSHYVEMFPFLRHVPFYGRHIRRWHTEELGLFLKQLQTTQDGMVGSYSYFVCF